MKPFLTIALFSWLVWGSLAQAQEITIWEYHHLTFAISGHGMTPQWFQDQMAWLNQNDYYGVSDTELASFLAGEIELPPRSVVLTFDLGTAHRQEYENIVLFLQQYHLHGIFFLVIDAITDDCRGNTHCWSALERWQKTGVVSFGSHSLYHQRYTAMNRTERLNDLIESKRIIEEHLGRIYGFAYPFESAPSGMGDLLQQAGYSYGLGGWSRNDFGIRPQDELWYNLPRLLPYSQAEIYPILSLRAEQKTFSELIQEYTP